MSLGFAFSICQMGNNPPQGHRNAPVKSTEKHISCSTMWQVLRALYLTPVGRLPLVFGLWAGRRAASEPSGSGQWVSGPAGCCAQHSCGFRAAHGACVGFPLASVTSYLFFSGFNNTSGMSVVLKSDTGLAG